MSSLLEQLKKKPIPKKDDAVVIDFGPREEPAKDAPLEITAKIVDKSSTSGLDRTAFLERLKKRAIVVPKVVALPPKPRASKPTTEESKPKVKKTKQKLRLRQPMPEHTKRLSKFPDHLPASRTN